MLRAYDGYRVYQSRTDREIPEKLRKRAPSRAAGGAGQVIVDGIGEEGFSPRYLRINGRWRDHERWALLADEDELD